MELSEIGVEMTDMERSMKGYEVEQLIAQRIREYEVAKEGAFVSKVEYSYEQQSLRSEMANNHASVIAEIRALQKTENERKKTNKQILLMMVGNLITPVLIAILWLLTQSGALIGGHK